MTVKNSVNKSKQRISCLFTKWCKQKTLFSFYDGIWWCLSIFWTMKSPRVTIQALHPFWFSFLHFQIILPDLAWFFMEYVNISASCMVLCWPALSWKGMNLSRSCSPRKNPAKFYWKYSFLFFPYYLLNWSQRTYLVLKCFCDSILGLASARFGL